MALSGLCSRAEDALGVYYLPETGNFYQPIEVLEGLTWIEAKNAAASTVYLGMTGHLATIESQTENAFVANWSGVDKSWIGGYRPSGSGDPDVGWTWITNESWDFTKWSPDQPYISDENANGLQLSGSDDSWYAAMPEVLATRYVVEYSSYQRGDFDGNRAIDTADLAIWQETYSSTGYLNADANGNGVIDGRDFLTWQRNYSTDMHMPKLVTMSELRSQPTGSYVTVSGVVSNTIDLVNSSTAKNSHLQDGSGGITVFESNFRIDQLLDGVLQGDKVVFSGAIINYAGLLELVPTDASRMTVVDHAGLPEPISITTADLVNMSASAEALESMVVRLSNVQFTATGTFAGLTNYTVTDGTTTAVVRVSTASQDLVGQPIPVGAVDLVGQMAQYDLGNPEPGVPGLGYQLYLRSLADITSAGAISAASAPEPHSIILLFLACMVVCSQRPKGEIRPSLRSSN
jgi:hypothetical protein